MLRDRPELPLTKQIGKAETIVDLITYKTTYSNWAQWFQSVISPFSRTKVSLKTAENLLKNKKVAQIVKCKSLQIDDIEYLKSEILRCEHEYRKDQKELMRTERKRKTEIEKQRRISKRKKRIRKMEEKWTQQIEAICKCRYKFEGFYYKYPRYCPQCKRRLRKANIHA